jgi:hypothetical protein
MTVTDVLPHIKQLQHADKLRLMQILLTDIASDEGIQLAPPASVKKAPAKSLGQQLRAMRSQALQQGMATLDWHEIEAEVHARRGR